MRKLGNVLGIIFLVILIPLLAINCTIIIKSYTAPNEIPFVFGTTMFAVETDSMNGTINSGDMIICKSADAEDVKVGDIIACAAPSSDGLGLITCRVTGITDNNGKLLFTTNKNTDKAEEEIPISEENVMGIYLSRIKGLGNAAMFMRTPLGLVLFVAAPLLLVLMFDMIRTKLHERKREKDIVKFMEEIEKLNKECGKVYN